MGLHGDLSAGRRGLSGAYRVLYNTCWDLNCLGFPTNRGPFLRGVPSTRVVVFMYRRGALLFWTCSSTRDFCSSVYRQCSLLLEP